jgi:GTP-binding protein HflX
LDVLAELGVREKPMVHVFNKMDLLAPEQAMTVRERISNLVPESVFVTTVNTDGLEPLRRALLRRARARHAVVELRIPLGDGRTLAEVYRLGEVLDQRADGETLVVSARVDEEAQGRLARFIP